MGQGKSRLKLGLAYGQNNSQRHENLKLNNFVSKVAWEDHDSVSPDEANLLLNIRESTLIFEVLRVLQVRDLHIIYSVHKGDNRDQED